jgi:hypothetical protein
MRHIELHRMQRIAPIAWPRSGLRPITISTVNAATSKPLTSNPCDSQPA